MLNCLLGTARGSLLRRQVSCIVEALSASPAFFGMPLEAMQEVGKVVEYRVLEKMAPAFLQGEELDAMVVILSGRCVLALNHQ